MKLVAAWRRACARTPNEYWMLHSVLTEIRRTSDPSGTRWTHAAIDGRRERTVSFDAAHRRQYIARLRIRTTVEPGQATTASGWT